MATLLTRLPSLIWPAIRGDIAYRTNLYLNRAPSASMSPVVGCGKWIGKTYLPVPAISVRNFRRDRAACAGSGFAALGRFLPGGIFAFVENIFGFRKCRHPASVAQHRVPAAMVDMQMRAEH